MAIPKNLPNTGSTETGEAYFVTIPQKTILGDRHPGVRINSKEFGPGTHTVSKEIAGELEQILARFNEAQVRLLQNRVDLDALAQLYKGSGIARQGAAFDASKQSPETVGQSAPKIEG